MKKIYSMSQVARELEISKERVRVFWNEGRMPHDREDQAGRPYWTRLPKKPEAIAPGRKAPKGTKR
ncbi:MAG TPA: hypothetical protein DCS42_15045 [Nitrospiraceae bacterium]|nr:hypothetical protein [Nitrospiraceae bacterium]